MPNNKALSHLGQLPAKWWEALHSVPIQSTRTELLDLPDNSPAELDDCFKDLQTINRYFGGIAPMRRLLNPFLPPINRQNQIRLLDIASGVADVPLALVKAWTKKGYQVSLTIIDLNSTHIELAKAAAYEQNILGSGPYQFEALAQDIFSPAVTQLEPFDFVTCSLAFHHFSPEQRLKALKLMATLSRCAFVVNDLERGWFGYWAAHLLGLTITRNRLVRHDAPLSVLRSFTKAEMTALAQAAQLPNSVQWQVKPALFSRLLLLGFH